MDEFLNCIRGSLMSHFIKMMFCFLFFKKFFNVDLTKFESGFIRSNKLLKIQSR